MVNNLNLTIDDVKVCRFGRNSLRMVRKHGIARKMGLMVSDLDRLPLRIVAVRPGSW